MAAMAMTVHMPLAMTVHMPLAMGHDNPNLYTSGARSGAMAAAPPCDSTRLGGRGRGKPSLYGVCVEKEQGVSRVNGDEDVVKFSGELERYAYLLEACGSNRDLSQGKQLHAHILINGLGHNPYLVTKLVSMYALCGSLPDAHLVFHKIPERKRKVILWNIMIREHTNAGLCEEALSLCFQMRRAGIHPNNYTFPSLLKSCAGLSALQHGKEIHNYIIRKGCEVDVFVGSALVDMYSKCGNIEYARHVFDRMSERNSVLYTSMVSGYEQNGQPNEALELFRQSQLRGLKPVLYMVVTILVVCSHLAALQMGKEIHGYLIRHAFQCDVYAGSALINLYSNCENTEIAYHVFGQMPERSVVLWNAMIRACLQNGYTNDALKHFHKMQLAGVKPNSTTILTVLPTFSYLAALQKGKEIHNYILRSGFDSDISVQTAVIDMYAKCGSIELACQVFDKMSQANVVSYTAMIAGYGMHGYGEDALQLFNRMQEKGMKPDHVTFVALLFACSHAGLVDEGLQYFEYMKQVYHITPQMEHYGCMVDLFCRAGQLYEAKNFIKKMHLEPDAGTWAALLNACLIYCNLELGEYVATRLLEVEPKDAGNYVLLSNVYAAAGRWDDAVKMRMMMKDSGLKRIPGCSWIELKNKVHAFLAGDRSDTQSQKIYATLMSLHLQMEEAGYIPGTSFVLHDVEEEEKEYILCGHSEKLAIAFGIINTCPGTPIQITKNLRVCGDCHNATKFISIIVGRKIIVRDANRFHHFNAGICSCGDYW